MRKAIAIIVAAICMVVAGGARAQSPDSPWCTPTSACSYYFVGTATGTFAVLQIPASATQIGVTLASDSVTSAYTVNLETAPLGSNVFTSCASGTLGTTAGTLTLTCSASATTPWGRFEVVMSGASAAGGFHARSYGVLPTLAGGLYNCPSYAPAGSRCVNGQIVFLAPVTAVTSSGPAFGFFDDFLCYPAPSVVGNIGSPTGASGNCGDNNSGFNVPGVYTLASGTTSAAGRFVAIMSNTGRPVTGLNTSGAVWLAEHRVQVPVLPGTTAGSYEDGLENQYGAALPWPHANTPAAFYLSSANAVPGDWYCVTAASATDAGTDTGIAATTGLSRFSILADGTNLHFYINGFEALPCKQAQTGTYSGNVLYDFAVQSGTTTSLNHLLDYASFYAQVTR